MADVNLTKSEIRLLNTLDYLKNYGIHAISGKLYYHDRELTQKQMQNFIIKNNFAVDLNDINNIINNVIARGSDDNWPELPLVKKARELGPLKKSTKLAFDLDAKQLQLINIMLFHPEEERLFITTGIGGSGKSTFLNIIVQLFNNDVASATLEDLQDNSKLALAVKHRLIASDELNAGEMNNGIVKTLASKQRILIDQKYIPAYEVKSQTTLFFCCNKAPFIDVADSGLLRRIVFYERNTKIENPVYGLQKKVYTEEELLTIARTALAYENKDWYEQFKEETTRYILKSNSIYLAYQASLEKPLFNGYQGYREWCYQNGFKPYNSCNWKEIYDNIIKMVSETIKEEDLPF